MSKVQYWYEVLSARVNGLAFTAKYGTAYMDGEKVNVGAKPMRVLVDEEGAILCPCDEENPAFTNIKGANRLPISPVVLRKSVDLVLASLNDPTGDRARIIETRAALVEEYVATIDQQIKAWTSSSCVGELCIPPYSLDEVEPDQGIVVFWNHLYAETEKKTGNGKTPEQIRQIVYRCDQTITKYFEWFANREAKVTEVETVL